MNEQQRGTGIAYVWVRIQTDDKAKPVVRQGRKAADLDITDSRVAI